MKKSNYYQFITKYLAGELREEDELSLKQWLNSSEENQQIFNEYKKIWEKVKTSEPETIPDFEFFWKNLSNKMYHDNLSDSEKSNIFPIFNLILRHRWLVAAAVLIITITFLVLYQNQFYSEGTESYYTRNAERRLLILPDSSKVQMNNASQVSFSNSDFDSERIVKLSGHAFFSVKKNGKPFVVKTENAQINVIGTSFDVKARNNITRVIVQSGTVEFAAENKTDNKIILRANQMSECIGYSLPQHPKTVNTKYLLGWLDNKLVFESTPLKEIVKELERVYDVKILLASRDLWNIKITGEFKNQKLEKVLEIICMTSDLKYELKNDIYIIDKD